MSDFYNEIVRITQESTVLDRIRRKVKDAAERGEWSVNLGRHATTPEARQQLEKEGFEFSRIDWHTIIRWKK